MKGLLASRALLVLLVLGGALAAGSVLPAVAQEAPTATLRIGREATLVAKGAAIRVPIRYSCSSDAISAQLSVQVFERVGGNRLAQGSGFTEDLVCDGRVHTAVVTTTATGNAFRRGDAVAQAQLLVCNEFSTCTFLETSRVITIVRR